MKTPLLDSKITGRLFAGFLLLAALFPQALRAQPSEGLEMFNPDWSMFINDHGYSDLAFDQRPGFEGREYLSGEWAAAMTYVTNSVTVPPVWLNPYFIFPDWVSDSDFHIESAVQQLPQNNAYGFAVLQSVIANGLLRIGIRSEFIDTTNGIPQGLSPRSAGSGASRQSDRYLLRQTFSITNISGQTLSSVKFFKFLHALEASSVLYDDRVYGPAYNGHHYTITQQSTNAALLPGEVVNQDIVCLHANVAPSAWEVGRYGIEGIDDHVTGKPSVGVHYSVEADALSGLDFFAPTNKWVSGAVRCALGTLAPNASTNIEFLMSLHSVTQTAPPFAIGMVPGVVGWGDDTSGQTNVPPGLTDAQAVAAGGRHSLALRFNGAVVAWGDNSHGQTNVPAGLTDVRAIAAGGNHSVALTSGGAVAAWGDNSTGQTNIPASLLAHVVAISAGSNYSLALLPDNTVVAWGDNSHGQTNVPGSVNSTGAFAIAAGGNHALAILWDGTTAAWGDDDQGQSEVPDIVNLYGASDIAAGGNHCLALLYDGTVAAWGDNSHGQTDVPGIVNSTGARAIAAGGNHSLALLLNGTVVAWGDNTHGQTNLPGGLNNVTALAAGGNHNLAISSSFSSPALTVTRSGNNAIISFPAPASTSDPTSPAVLEETGALGNSNWTQNAAFGVIENGAYKVTVPVGAGTRFYHLRITGP